MSLALAFHAETALVGTQPALRDHIKPTERGPCGSDPVPFAFSHVR